MFPSGLPVESGDYLGSCFLADQVLLSSPLAGKDTPEIPSRGKTKGGHNPLPAKGRLEANSRGPYRVCRGAPLIPVASHSPVRGLGYPRRYAPGHAPPGIHLFSLPIHSTLSAAPALSDVGSRPDSASWVGSNALCDRPYGARGCRGGRDLQPRWQMAGHAEP
jgi:hypothetical protein